MTREEARKKAEYLVGQMTLEEKASQLKYDAPAIKRLKVPGYNWWNETLHGVARAGTATVFPQVIGMAAAFDDELIGKIAEVISTEVRAKYNAASAEGDCDIYKGITAFSPNVNIFRDPRWGRGHETYGEDPYLTSKLGTAYIKGLQGEGEYLKVSACVKHYAVHSGPEEKRHEFNAVVNEKDLWETYLPAFEACVKEGQAESVMGAYNRTNGEPCCGSKALIKDILRGKWEFKGHFVSDCWAIKDFHEYHMVTKTPTESASLALKTGCDLNCGNIYLLLLKAQQEGLITEEDITRAAVRLFTTRYLLGMGEETEYDKIPYEVVECKEHRDLAVKTAEKSIVLLKNDGILPISNQIKSIGVIGPNANSRAALIGNYHGTSSRYTTILEGIQKELDPEVRVYYSEGCHLSKDRVENLAWSGDRISEAVTVAKNSEVVVLCLGLDETLEGEEGDDGNSYFSGDKEDLELPKCQKELLEKVLAVGKPTVLCLLSGSSLNISYAKNHVNGILQAWYPGAEGGTAVANLLFGKKSPSGKLPITFYESTELLPDFEDYAMKGRTYRYLEGNVLYPFGYGLTYSKVTLDQGNVVFSADNYSGCEVKVEVTNVGNFDIDEVVQVYIKDLKSPYAVTNHSLCGFKRISLSKGETKQVTIPVSENAFTCVDEKGNRKIESDSFTLYVGISQPDELSVSLCGVKPLEIPVANRG